MYGEPGAPVPGSALDQLGLKDGEQQVRHFVDHNEAGLALEHLLYMIEEPEIELSEIERTALLKLGRMLGFEEAVVCALKGGQANHAP